MASMGETVPIRSISHSRPSPVRKPRYMTRLPLGAPDFESLKSIGDVHEVVIAIEEDHIAAFQHIPQPSKAFTAPSRNLAAPSFRLQAPTPPLADRPTSPISLTVSCPSPSSPSHSRSVSPISVESSARSHTSSPTLVRKASITSPGTYSPVMRSMFPHYDPTISLGQQRYFPQIAVSPPAAIYSTRTDDVGSYTPSLYTQQEPSFDGEAVGWSNGLGLHSEGEFLDGPSESPQFSTPDELLSWWALANGQTTAEDAKDYKLELSCDNLEAGKEIICFDSSTSQSLYSLTATNDHLSISRSHPLNDTTTIQISALTLQTPSSSSSLIATISPKLAELAAIDKSSSAAVEHRLDRKASTALQTEAVERACRQEASSLLWDGESRKYYLIHPTLLEDNSPAAFPIEVTSHEGTPRAIKILAPGDFPNLPVLELSFETLCLDIHVEVITAYSSRYLLDTLLSTTLVLLLHLHRSRPSSSSSSSSSPSASPAVSAIPFFDPPPTCPSPLNPQRFKKDRRLTSWSKSFFTPSRSAGEKKKQRRLDDEESATAVTVQGSPDPSSVTAKLPHLSPPKSTFQVVDPTDERLPRGTRAALRLLYWGFGCLFWALGVLVNVLAVVVVGLGKLVKAL